MLILHYWKSGPIPDDDARLATISRMGDAWSNASSTLRAFFEHENGMLMHSRIDREKADAIDNKGKNQARAKAAAEKRWGKNAPSNAPSMPQAMLGECPSPSPTSLLKPSSKTKATATPPALPDWIPADAWLAFLAMRKSVKKPITDSAVPLAVSKLDKLRAAGNDPRAVLEQSTLNSWQGLFEVKVDSTARAALPPRASRSTAAMGANALAFDDPFAKRATA